MLRYCNSIHAGFHHSCYWIGAQVWYVFGGTRALWWEGFVACTELYSVFLPLGIHAPWRRRPQFSPRHRRTARFWLFGNTAPPIPFPSVASSPYSFLEHPFLSSQITECFPCCQASLALLAWTPSSSHGEVRVIDEEIVFREGCVNPRRRLRRGTIQGFLRFSWWDSRRGGWFVLELRDG
jgi:hypothetical protein